MLLLRWLTRATRKLHAWLKTKEPHLLLDGKTRIKCRPQISPEISKNKTHQRRIAKSSNFNRPLKVWPNQKGRLPAKKTQSQSAKNHPFLLHRRWTKLGNLFSKTSWRLVNSTKFLKVQSLPEFLGPKTKDLYAISNLFRKPELKLIRPLKLSHKSSQQSTYPKIQPKSCLKFLMKFHVRLAVDFRAHNR